MSNISKEVIWFDHKSIVAQHQNCNPYDYPLMSVITDHADEKIAWLERRGYTVVDRVPYMDDEEWAKMYPKQPC